MLLSKVQALSAQLVEEGYTGEVVEVVVAFWEAAVNAGGWRTLWVGWKRGLGRKECCFLCERDR